MKVYAPDRRVRIITVLYEYLARVKPLRKSGCWQLFVSFNKPHDAVSKDTVARWIKIVMSSAGLDTTIFTPHSVRGCSTSAAFRARVPVQTILDTAGWSKESTLAKYYNKPLQQNDFSKSILEGKRK